MTDLVNNENQDIEEKCPNCSEDRLCADCYGAPDMGVYPSMTEAELNRFHSVGPTLEVNPFTGEPVGEEWSWGAYIDRVHEDLDRIINASNKVEKRYL